jgi:hypothetical protein
VFRKTQRPVQQQRLGRAHRPDRGLHRVPPLFGDAEAGAEPELS